MDQLRIVFVDDNRRFLETAAGSLAAYPEVEIVGMGFSGLDALRLSEVLLPDLILMDLSMPEMNGLEATRCIKARPLSPHIVMLTMYEGAEFSALAQQAGADGFVTKSDFSDSLWPLILKLFPRLQAEAIHEIA